MPLPRLVGLNLLEFFQIVLIEMIVLKYEEALLIHGEKIEKHELLGT